MKTRPRHALVALSLTLLLVVVAACARADDRAHVLIFSSGHPGEAWGDALLAGVDAELLQAPESIGRWVEYLDALRFRGVTATRSLARLYERKFHGTRFDVVLALGGPALAFAVEHRERLFPGAPIVYAGVDQAEAAAFAGARGITGVVQPTNPRDTLDVALALRPDVERIVFVSPDLRNRHVADSLLADYRPDLEVRFWHDSSAEALLQRVATLERDAIVLPLALPGEIPVPTKDGDRFLEALARTSAAPVFALRDVDVRNGVVGGVVTSASAQGRAAGSLALRLARGAPVESVATVLVERGRPIFDARALERFGITRASVPADAIVIDDAVSVYREYRAVIWGAAAVVVGLCAVVAVLVHLLASRRRAERAVAQSEARFRSVFDNSPMVMVLKDFDGRYVMVNRAFERQFGVLESEVRGRTSEQVLPAEVGRRLRAQDLEVMDDGRVVEREYDMGGARDVGTALVVKFPVTDADGRIVGVGSAAMDISERKRALEALAQSELRYQSLYDNAPDIYFTLGDGGRIDSVNRFGAAYLGHDKVALEGRPLLDLVHPADRLQVAEELDRLFRAGGAALERKAEFRMNRVDGGVLWVHMRAGRTEAADGGAPELRLICRDITDAHKLSEELAYQAAHDALTGLVNRREFERRLGRALKASGGDGSLHALCFMDLDQFKVVNDTCGHAAGDELLRQLGQLIAERVRGRDVVARLGGDEFAVFMEHCPLEQARRIAEEIRAAVEAFRFAWHDQVFSIGTSIGLVPVSAGSGGTADILASADAACYVAKQQGRNRIHVHTPDSAEIARHRGEMQWIARIQRAIEDDEFELWYQPIVPVAPAPGEQAARPHMELLLRLARPGQAPIRPRSFLPSVERFGLGARVDRWVVRRAFAWMAGNPAWLAEFDTCFINLSGQSLADETFLDYVVAEFAASSVRPDRVCFEVTETAAISNLTSARRFMTTLRAKGCRFALDDFGSGLSSFAHLRRLPVDFLKIDGVFVRDSATDQIDAAMLRSINEIGSVMGKITIAEFVESVEVLELLGGIGVDYAQGHYVGRPLPLPRGAEAARVHASQ